MLRPISYLLASFLFAGLSNRAPAQPADAAGPIRTMEVLQGVEKRYNATNTLQADFIQTYTDRGRSRTPQRGVVYLNKPGKTRWVYTAPEGDFFLSDGKFGYDYNKAKNTAERFPMKQTDDMRIPLAFLLGRLDFKKDFAEFRAKREGADSLITAVPKNSKLLFTEITMLIGPDSAIKRVAVTGQDYSVMEFVLANEKRNLKLADSLFRFTPPPGAKVVETGDN